MSKSKNGRRKSKNGEEEEAAALKEMIEKLHERQKSEEERQNKWDEAWERKLAEEERCEDLKACCAPGEYFPAPRAQSNIWLQVSHERNTQRVKMAFMNTPVPKPPPPPLPRLKPVVDPCKKEENPWKSEGKKKKKK